MLGRRLGKKYVGKDGKSCWSVGGGGVLCQTPIRVRRLQPSFYVAYGSLPLKVNGGCAALDVLGRREVGHTTVFFFFSFLLALVEGLPGKFLQTMHGMNGMVSFLMQYNTFTYLSPYLSSHTATSLLSTIVPLELSLIIC